jgi:hypothetical protein
MTKRKTLMPVDSAGQLPLLLAVLFLDVDGVLNSHRTWAARRRMPWLLTPEHIADLDPVALTMIRNICTDYDVKVVISSSWRVGKDRTPKAFADAFQLPVIGCTPEIHTRDRIRGDEIKMWLDANPVDRYAIIDDDSDMLPEQQPFFVHTTHEDGMLYRHYTQLESIFQGRKKAEAA